MTANDQRPERCAVCYELLPQIKVVEPRLCGPCWGIGIRAEHEPGATLIVAREAFLVALVKADGLPAPQAVKLRQKCEAREPETAKRCIIPRGHEKDLKEHFDGVAHWTD